MEDKPFLEPLVKTLYLEAPIEKVWKAVATSEGLSSWFMLNDFVPEAGHVFNLNRGQFGVSPCVVRDIAPLRKLEFSWGKDWIVSFKLKETAGMTEVTVTHGGWDAEKYTEFRAPHPSVHENMDIGWGNLIKKLYLYVEETDVSEKAIDK